jgi:hypothetical protein
MDGVLCLPDEDVEYLLKISVRPLNRQDFTMKLIAAVETPEFPKSYEFSFATYDEFESGILELNRRFFEAIKVLTDVIAPECLSKIEPPMNYNKEPKGYPRIYIEKIPFGQGPILLGQTLDGREWKSFPNIFSFIEKLTLHVTETSKKFHENRVVCEYQHIPIGPKKVAGASYDSRSDAARFQDSRGGILKRPSAFSKGYPPRAGGQSLRNLESDEVASESALQAVKSIPWFEDEFEEEAVDQRVAELSAVASVDRATQPCFEKMRSGVCDKRDCPYKHDDAILKAGILRRLENILKYPLFKQIGVKISFPQDYRFQSSDEQKKSALSTQRRLPGMHALAESSDSASAERQDESDDDDDDDDYGDASR